MPRPNTSRSLDSGANLTWTAGSTLTMPEPSSMRTAAPCSWRQPRPSSHHRPAHNPSALPRLSPLRSSETKQRKATRARSSLTPAAARNPSRARKRTSLPELPPPPPPPWTHRPVHNARAAVACADSPRGRAATRPPPSPRPFPPLEYIVRRPARRPGPRRPPQRLPAPARSAVCVCKADVCVWDGRGGGAVGTRTRGAVESGRFVRSVRRAVPRRFRAADQPPSHAPSPVTIRVTAAGP